MTKRSTGSVRILTLAAVLALAGCKGTTAPLLTQWEGTLFPVRPATVGGRVVAVTQHGRTDLGILIEDGEPDTTYGWRVNAGTCESQGTMQGGIASYTLLDASGGGSAEGSASISQLFRPDDQYAARVYVFDEGQDAVVACGELVNTG